MQTFNSPDHKMKRKLSLSSSTDVIQTSKVKLLVIAATLATLATFVLTRFSQNFAGQLNYNSRLVAYPHCVLTGKGQCSMANSADGVTDAAATLYDVMVYFLLGGLTYFNLIFPLKPSDYAAMFRGLCCLCARYGSKPAVHETQPEN